MKLNHSELVKKIAQNSRFEVKDTSLFMKALKFSVVDDLKKEGDVVYLQGIGKFTVILRKGKKDKLNGKERKTKNKLVIVFKPAKGLVLWNIDDMD